MKKSEKIKIIINELRLLYPNVQCELVYNKPHELLIATRLSAQCTDKRVNLVTPELFRKYTNIESFANADVTDVENIIKSCGLYKTKAADIITMCKQLRDDYKYQIPDSIDELVKLSGVGRKTANLIIGDLYGKYAVVTDTHVIRLSNRLGLVKTKDPFKVETELRKLVPKTEGIKFSHRLVHHGRAICDAKKPKCSECTLGEICVFKEQNS